MSVPDYPPLMLLTEPVVDTADLTRRTGWKIEPRGACKGDMCVPLPAGVHTSDDRIDAVAFAEALRLPVEHDDQHGLWALGPESGGPVLTTVDVPDLTLPDLVTGEEFSLASLKGRKIIMVAWASW